MQGRTIAFSGPSGVGKSSVAAHLVADGAALVTDDVLALDSDGEEILAYPGAGLAGLDRRELAAMTAEGRRRLGPRVGMADKVYVHPPVVDAPRPLRAVYFLLPGAGESIEIRESDSPAPLLLAAAFIAYLRDPAMSLAHLDVCARVAEAVPAFEVAVPWSAGAQQAARAVGEHALETLR